jgi:hypothetical protein
MTTILLKVIAASLWCAQGLPDHEQVKTCRASLVQCMYGKTNETQVMSCFIQQDKKGKEQ